MTTSSTMRHHCQQMLVILAMLVGTLSSMRAETLTWNCYQATITLTDDGKLTVSKLKGDGKMDDFTENTPSPWYENEIRTRVKTIVIEEGVTHIGNYAFYNLEQVTSVTIAESVTSIGSRAFCNCFILRELNIPASVTRIGADAFYLCQNLLNVNFHANPANITEWTDNDCNDFALTGTKSTAVHVYNRFLTGYQQKFSGVNVTFTGFDDVTAPVIDYPVWVGDTQVNSRNKTDVLGNGIVSYTPGTDSGTLTFAEPTTINGQHTSAKIYARDIDLTINAPKGLTLENTSEGIYINSNSKTLTINGNVNINSAGAGIVAYNVVLNGTDNVITSGEELCIAAEGSLTINGKLTATISNSIAGPISYPAILTMSTITIPEGYEITEPKNGQIMQFKVNDVSFTSIAGTDGNYVPHVVIAPHVHSMKETTGKGATCTETGFETYWTCTSCNKMFSDEQGENEISAPREIPATGHIWGEWVVTREATTTQEGEETRTCLNDPSHQETRTIPMLTISGLAIDATNFPDENFRDFLLKQDYGRDGYLTASEIENCTEMDAIFLDAISLKGIEHFTALKVLKCYGNDLTELDITKNTALETLICHNNQLTTLDLSNNTALKELDCVRNQLTTLDLSNNTALLELDFMGNLLTTIDLSKNTALEQLYCSENQLTALDVSKNTALKVIECSENKLTEIDITKNVALVVLDCRDNQIHTINVSPDCTALMAIDSRHNQLKGENVDALIENLPMKTANAQGMIGFCVEDNEEGNIMTPEQVAAATQKYWQILYWQEGAKDDDFMLYPGSTTQIQSLERTSTEPGATENWYDLHGHKLNSQPKKKGLYIKNGKKVVVN